MLYVTPQEGLNLVHVVEIVLSVFFWVFPRRLVVVCRRFGTLCLFNLQRLDVKYEVWLVRGGHGIYTGAEVYSSWRDQ